MWRATALHVQFSTKADCGLPGSSHDQCRRRPFASQRERRFRPACRRRDRRCAAQGDAGHQLCRSTVRVAPSADRVRVQLACAGAPTISATAAMRRRRPDISVAGANPAAGDLLALDVEQNTQGSSMTLAQAEAFVQVVFQRTGTLARRLRRQLSQATARQLDHIGARQLLAVDLRIRERAGDRAAMAAVDAVAIHRRHARSWSAFRCCRCRQLRPRFL